MICWILREITSAPICQTCPLASQTIPHDYVYPDYWYSDYSSYPESEGYVGYNGFGSEFYDSDFTKNPETKSPATTTEATGRTLMIAGALVDCDHDPILCYEHKDRSKTTPNSIWVEPPVDWGKKVKPEVKIQWVS